MACYNAITGSDPCDCLFKKQWEWEEVVRFHTPGWETWAGPRVPLTDSRSQVLRNSGNAERPIAFGLSPPIKSEQANHGGPGEGPGLAVVDPTWDYGAITQAGEKKRKSNLRKEKTHGGGGVRSEGGGGGETLCFTINRIVEVVWPQTAPEKRTVREERSVLKESWIYSTASRQVFRTDFGRSRRSALRDRCSATIPARHDLLITDTTS